MWWDMRPVVPSKEKLDNIKFCKQINRNAERQCLFIFFSFTFNYWLTLMEQVQFLLACSSEAILVLVLADFTLSRHWCKPAFKKFLVHWTRLASSLWTHHQITVTVKNRWYHFYKMNSYVIEMQTPTLRPRDEMSHVNLSTGCSQIIIITFCQGVSILQAVVSGFVPHIMWNGGHAGLFPDCRQR